MSLKFLGPDGGSTADAITALDYGLDMKARGVPVSLTNNSWGGGGDSQSLEDKIGEADAAGQLFVAAAGNSGDDIDSTASYPASYPKPNIVAVAATDDDDGLASFSNYGETSVDLGAPGVSILSTVPPFGKGVLVGPETDTSVGYRSALHPFGLEGALDPADGDALLAEALSWTRTATGDPVLVVDDDEGQGFESVYTGAVSSLGYTNVDVYTVSTGGAPHKRTGPDAARMSAYDVVIWLTGADADSTLLSTDQDNLATHLDGGGQVLLFGQDIGYDLTGDGSSENAFLRDYLRADYLADTDYNWRPVGQANTPYAGVPTIELNSRRASEDSTGQFWTDAYAPRSGAVAGLRGTPTNWFSGTSMASPHMAGAAAQAFASYPGIGHLDVKTRLMDQGDAVASLDGKTVSGNRLNLAGALDTAGAPTLSDASASTNPFTPNGDGVNDTTTFTWTQNEPAEVTVTVTPDGATDPIRTELLGPKSAGTHTWTWDGQGRWRYDAIIRRLLAGSLDDRRIHGHCERFHYRQHPGAAHPLRGHRVHVPFELEGDLGFRLLGGHRPLHELRRQRRGAPLQRHGGPLDRPAGLVPGHRPGLRGRRRPGDRGHLLLELEHQVVLFEATGLTDGSHALAVVYEGHNPSAPDWAVVIVDAVEARDLN